MVQELLSSAIIGSERGMVLIPRIFNIQYRTRNIQYPNLTATATAISVSLTLAMTVGYHNYSAIMHNTGIVLSHILAGVDSSGKAVAFT